MSGGVTVTAATPNFGSLLGGTHIVLEGTGFTVDGAAPDRVLIAGHEAPLAGAVDDLHLEVEVPPSDTPGDAEIVVFNHRGQGKAMGIFHYSTSPTIASLTPGAVLYTTTSTVMTITGTGFKDEDAGFVHVKVDGVDAVDVSVTSDTEVRFTAFTGTLLTQPTVTVENARGTGTRTQAFRYVPSTHHGLIIFPRVGSADFVDFFDPTDQSLVAVDRLPTVTQPIFATAMFTKGNDVYGADRNSHFGKVDFKNQTLGDQPFVMPNTLNSMVLVGDNVFAVQRDSFGTFAMATATFTRLAAAPHGGELAANAAGNLFIAYSDSSSHLAPISPAGVLGTAVTLSAFYHVCDMRFLDNTLYALVRDNNTGINSLATIDPSSGATTLLKTFADQRNAMEVFQ